jgi:RHS repeat-associated protein
VKPQNSREEFRHARKTRSLFSSASLCPEQGIGTVTTSNCNPDDNVYSVTDARGSVSNFSYNSRHLITGMTYDPSTGISDTPDVSFAYDNAGNRTSMTDGLGSVSYVYNTLSQLTSETRSFSGVGSFSLSYAYNLAGELTSMTNQWGAQVGYNYDATGRPISVSGSGYAGVTSYVNSIAYRAFGMKQMNYANGKTLSLSHDNRMRVTQWNVPGVMGWNYSYNNFNEGTGRVTYAQNLNDATLDRSFDYDNVGRLIEAHTGSEARGHLIGQGGAQDGPYSHSYRYDQFGNPWYRVGWGGSHGAWLEEWPSYTSNRRNGLQYDAAGNLTNDGSQSYSYDATGQQSYASGSGGGAPTFTNDPLVAGQTEVKALHVTELRTAINQLRAGVGLAAYAWQYSVTTNDWITANPILEMRTALDQALGAPSPAYSAGLAQGQPILAIHLQELRERVKAALSSPALSQSYDGDRLRVKKSEYGIATYYVRSSVLGGQVVAELGASGNWTRGYVYLGGQMLAIQGGSGGQVSWVHQDPVTKSQRITNSGGAVTSTIDLDPWGGETARSSNAAFQPHKYTTYERDANGGDEAMHRRYQSSFTRFSQPDPSDGSYDATDPQSFNRYSYVQNDPVNFVDPSGLDAEDYTEVISTDIWAAGVSWLYWRFLFWSPGGGGGGGSDPGGGGGGGQNPDVPGTTELVNDILSKQKCIDFANRILNAVSTKDNPLLRGGDLQQLFKDFLGQKKGGYTRTKPPGSAGYGSPIGLIRKGDGKIFSRAYPSMSGSQQTAYDAGTTVAELFHMAGRNEFYTDRALAEAAHSIPEYRDMYRENNQPQWNVFDPRYVDKVGAAKNPNHGGWSSYFHDIQRQLCGP